MMGIARFVFIFLAVNMSTFMVLCPIFGQTNSVTQAKSKSAIIGSIIKEGIKAEVSMSHLNGSENVDVFSEGDDILFKVVITDTTSENGLSGAFPAGWIDDKSKRHLDNSDGGCLQKINAFIGGSLLARPDLDLNVYYVLALNDDATISVVDPLFGFGGSKLLTLIPLKSPGMDWTLNPTEDLLFVSQPAANAIAVINTDSWEVINQIIIDGSPSRIVSQENGKNIWVTYNANDITNDSGVALINAQTGLLEAQITTGGGWHDLVVSKDELFVFVTNESDNSVSVIDIETKIKIRDIKTGNKPVSIDWSSAANSAYVSHFDSGNISVITANDLLPLNNIQIGKGISRIKFDPSGRYGFLVQPDADLVYIIDASTNRVVQTGKMESGPDQITFSDEMAYVRHRGSVTVLMIPLEEIGHENQPLPVVDFPGGYTPAGSCSYPSPADGIVQAPGSSAVLLANPGDKTIYFFKEGMAAPMGSFSNYDRQPRAVLAKDNSLREVSPGVYQTTAKLRKAGDFSFHLFLDVPRMADCFDFTVSSNKDIEKERLEASLGRFLVFPAMTDRRGFVDEKTEIRVVVLEHIEQSPITDIEDLEIMAMHTSGVWSERRAASNLGKGMYQANFDFSDEGLYYIYVQSPSMGFYYNNPQYFIVNVVNKN